MKPVSVFGLFDVGISVMVRVLQHTAWQYILARHNIDYKSNP
jgi:hypothetical protein